MASIEYDKRFGHVKRLFGVTSDGEGGEVEDTSVWLDVYRTDRFTYINDSGKKFAVFLNWNDEEDEDNLHAFGRVVSTKRLTDPQGTDEENPDFWFNMHIIDQLKLTDKETGKEWPLKFKNDNPRDYVDSPDENNAAVRRKVWIRRVVHWDTPYEDGEKVYVKNAMDEVDGYKREGEEDTDQYIDQEIPAIIHFMDKTTPESKDYTVSISNYRMATNFRSVELDEIQQEREKTFPPIRLDPLQVIVNCQLNRNPKRPTDVVAFKVWEYTEVDGLPTHSLDDRENAFITEDNSLIDEKNEKEKGKKLKYVRGHDYPPATDFEKLKWPKVQRERGKFLMSYQDGEDNFKAYVAYEGINYYKNGTLFSENISMNVSYIKKVGKEEQEKFSLSDNQIKDAYHVVSSGNIDILNVRTRETIKSKFTWQDMDPLRVEDHTISSDFLGNTFALVKQDGENETDATVYSWDKWGELRWTTPLDVRHTVPLYTFLLISTPGIDDYITYGIYEQAAPQWGSIDYSQACCIGQCYVFAVNRSLSVTEGDGDTIIQTQFPDEWIILGYDAEGKEILHEKFQTNSIISTITGPVTSTSTHDFGGTNFSPSYPTVDGVRQLYQRWPPTVTQSFDLGTIGPGT